MKKKVAILTTFRDFMPGYSLTGIVKDQAKMLAKHGHEVHLFVCADYHGEKFSEDVKLRKLVPKAALTDYDSKDKITDAHLDVADQTAKMIEEHLGEFDIIFTHDFVFIGWNLPYALGIQQAAGPEHANEDIAKLRWLHWIHSIPSGQPKDWWLIDLYGAKHKLVYPNDTDRVRVGEYFRGSLRHVKVIHHIKDIRTWFDFDEESWQFIDEFPALLQAELTQIYPASTDRLFAKRVDTVSLLFSKFKQQGHSVFLAIANQWCSPKLHKDDLDKYRKIAQRNGLKYGKEFVFTSDWLDGKYETGLPKRILRDLMLCGNVFLFPTREETFGLVCPEAALSGAVFPVLNKSLDMQWEVNGGHGLYFDFGSYHRNHDVSDENAYHNAVASTVIGRIKENEVIRHRTFIKRSLNMDFLYQREYLPIMEESETW